MKSTASAFCAPAPPRPEEKLSDGPRLFDFACRVMKDGIRMQFPNADEDEVRRILLERLAIPEKLEK